MGSPHPLIGGAEGAAWATIFSQYVAVSLFMIWPFDKHEQEIKDYCQRKPIRSPGASARPKPNESTRGFSRVAAHLET